MAGNLPFSRGAGFARLGRDEFQGDTVDAIAEPRRLGAVIEHVAEMAAAAAAMHLLAHHAEGEIGVLLHRVLDRRIEARPASAAIELGLGGEERQVAAGAGEGPLAMLFVEGTGEGALGVRFAQYGVLV